MTHTDLLRECLDAFDGEEDSVKREHADLIKRLRAALTPKSRSWRAKLLECLPQDHKVPSRKERINNARIAKYAKEKRSQ